MLATTRTRAADDPRLASEIAIFADGQSVAPLDFGFAAEPFAESGYTVPIGLQAVNLAEGERITVVRILAPANPLVRVATARFGPHAPAVLSTRIRLARSQTVTALARTSAGRVLRQDRRIEVLVGGCGFDVETPG